MGDAGGQLVHSWDTERRRVRCGASGETRSTKHGAGVTCPACREALGAGAPAPAPEEGSPHDGA